MDIMININPTLSLPEKIDTFIKFFPSITKEESDFIASILKWDNASRQAFLLAKMIFEDRDG